MPHPFNGLVIFVGVLPYKLNITSKIFTNMTENQAFTVTILYFKQLK